MTGKHVCFTIVRYLTKQGGVRMQETEEKYLGKMVRILSNLIRRKIENELNQSGIEITSSQARIISFVYRQSKLRNIYQKDIEEEFDIRRSTVTNTLQLLEKDGYIQRVSVNEDARLKKILLTDKGIEIYEIVRNCITKVEEELNSVYSKDELNDLFFLLDKLYAYLNK